MALKPGTMLGPHEILSLIGAGGMGEVYKARDTRLDRLVAIKTLPAHLADRPELRERFKREAHMLANLKHAHVCVLYDIGHQELAAEDFDGSGVAPPSWRPVEPAGLPRAESRGSRRTVGIDYLVMEYLEGETLAERLKKGPLPLEQVLRYADEIADALTTAHRQSFTHRDIKPANIMLTKEGSKLLDFGLAKLKQEIADAITPASERPTAPGTLTQQGTLLGTLQYMAPEQVEGKTDDIDGRTDIFAFGAVVYEMATGKKAFEGQTQASVIAAILKGEPPPMSSLQPIVPPALERVVKRCLAKDQDERWQTAFDLWHAVKWVAQDTAQPAPPPPAVSATVAAPPARASRRQVVIWSLASLVLAVLVGLAGWHFKPTASPTLSSAAHFILTLPPGQQLADVNSPVLAVSPDGTRLAYVALSSNAPQQIYIRPIDSPEAKPLPGTEGAFSPFFSPDGQWLAFFVANKLAKVSLSGGAPVTISNPGANLYLGATWGTAGDILFQSQTAGDLWRLSADGGIAQRLNTLDSKKGEISSRWPELLPDAKALLFAAGSTYNIWSSSQLAVYNLKTGERRNLPQSGARPRYAPTGHLLYAQAGTLMAAPFDLQRMEVTRSPVPVADAIMQSGSSGVAQYSFSENGVLAYVSGGTVAGQRTLVWVDRKGAEQPLGAPVRNYTRNPRLSPDGRRVVVPIDAQIWIYDIARETLTRLTFEGASNDVPLWTPDGKRIVFGLGVPPNPSWQPADGSGKAERLTTSQYLQAINSWTPDGQVAAFVEITPTTAGDIWTLNLKDRKAQPFIKTPANEGAPAFSPDGHWLAYSSDESGRTEIYVQPYPGPGGKWQVSTEGGTEPVWNRNGKEMFYRSGNKMMVVDVEGIRATAVSERPSNSAGGSSVPTGFSAGKPRMLFEGSYLPTPGTFPNYDVSPDGQRFLMLKASEQGSAPTQIHVVLNWFEELRRRAPVTSGK